MGKEMRNKVCNYVGSWLLVLVLATLFLAPARSDAAAYGELGGKTRMYAWPLKKSAMTVYSDPELTEKIEKVPYSEYEILSMSEETVQVRYKKDGVKSKGYVPAENFIYNMDYKKTGAYIRGSGMYLYKRPTSAKKDRYLLFPYRSGGITLGVKGKYVQMMMERNCKFYLGWVTMSTLERTVYRSMLHTDQSLADGTYTLEPRVQTKTSAPAEKYKLKYQGKGLYTLRSTRDKSYLSIDESRNLMIVRSGEWFYIRSEDEETGLGCKGSEVIAGDVKKQQWVIKKVYAVPTVQNVVVYSQYDPEFGSTLYKNGYDGPRTISSSGCGLMALVNAIYALNGEYIPPKELANFSASRGHYFYNQGTSDTLYADVSAKWGATYHFRHTGKTFSFETLKSHLQKKGTAVALVPGRYIAIVAYNKSNGKYLVLDSAVSGSRPTSIYGNWKTMSDLRSGRLNCEYFHLFSAR